MADAFITPPKDTAVLIKLYHKDLAEVMFQAAQKPEVLANLRNDQLERILFELGVEHQERTVTKNEKIEETA